MSKLISENGIAKIYQQSFPCLRKYKYKIEYESQPIVSYAYTLEQANADIQVIIDYEEQLVIDKLKGL